jgi:hypothetical protein
MAAIVIQDRREGLVEQAGAQQKMTPVFGVSRQFRPLPTDAVAR